MAFDLIPGSSIISSGLNAERERMEVVANNLSNVNSTSPNGSAYRRRVPVFEAVYNDEMNGGAPGSDLGGVKVSSIDQDSREPNKIYAPYHPYAGADGMLEVPNISPIEEMLDLVTASRAYEANLAAMKQAKDMADKTVQLGKA